MSLIRVSAGSTKGYGTKLTIADSNGIEAGYSSHTVTFRQTPAKWLEFGAFESANSVRASSDAANLSVQRFQMPTGMSVSAMDMLQHYTVAASTAGSYSWYAALYTLSGSTASRATSASGVVTHNSGQTNTTAGSVYGGQSGTQWRSHALAATLSPGPYLLAYMVSIDGPAGTTGSMTAYGRSAISIAGFGALTNANPARVFDGGVFSAATASPPASIHISDINRTGSYALAQPGFRLVGSF